MSERNEMRKACALLFGSLAFVGSVMAGPNHLDLPGVYDNAETPLEYGQTFIAENTLMSGVRVYIGNPSDPDNPTVNELIGPADLVLYDASNLLQPIEIGRSLVVPSGTSLEGLVSLVFDAPVPTVIGNRYCFVLSTVDSYGIGLRQQHFSTYPGGAEVVRDPSTGEITENPLGRDL